MTTVRPPTTVIPRDLAAMNRAMQCSTHAPAFATTGAGKRRVILAGSARAGDGRMTGMCVWRGVVPDVYSK